MNSSPSASCRWNWWTSSISSAASGIVFYFLAEKRVDFRELVKDLAREYQTRIEMRQIGVRDEAKLLADYGDCGKPVCCNTHMAVMPPVSMRMAKLQKSTLDPSKISGRCGRLKCCLRFEQDVYEEFQAELPPPGTRIVTAKGQGRVLAQEILALREVSGAEIRGWPPHPLRVGGDGRDEGAVCKTDLARTYPPHPGPLPPSTGGEGDLTPSFFEGSTNHGND